MDELRDNIWNHVFEAGGAESLASLATATGHDEQTVRAVVNHEWFEVAGDQVMIAYSS